MKIIEQEYIITSPLNKTAAFIALQQQLESTIFDELINGENEGIRLKFIIELIQDRE